MPAAVTHDGPFHADDVFACAMLGLLHEDLSVERTRDPARIAAADIVFDVGGEYDPARMRYDHHQRGRPLREDGTPYSSAGLVWRHHGRDVIRRALPRWNDPGLQEQVWRELDGGLVRLIDLIDNGLRRSEVGDVAWLVEQMVPTSGEKAFDDLFMDACIGAERLLRRAFLKAYDAARSVRYVAERAARAEDPRIVVLDVKAPWQKAIFDGGFERALFVVHPAPEEGKWMCVAVPPEPGSFGQRLPLPEAWAGLRDGEFSAVAGIPDGVFCHPSRFICGAASRESAVELARRAIALGA